MSPYVFRCPQAGCDASYTRKSHLTRHMGKHQAVLRPCPWCKRTFTRQDSLRKHAKLHHPCREVGRTRSVAACLLCKRRKTRCDGSNPCGYCSERRLECVYGKAILDHSPRFDLQQRTVNVSRYIHLYFERVHPRWPFLHRASFGPETEPPMLVQAVVMTGILASGEKGELPVAMLLYRKLSDSIRLQRERWDVSSSATVLENASWPMSTYQGILLCIIFGTMVECIQNRDGGLGVDMEILVALVRSCHRRGMFNYYHMVAQYHKPSPDDAEALYIWTAIEEAKRFALALHQVWKMHQSCTAKNIYSGTSFELSHLQLALPCSQYIWEATSRTELAERMAAEFERGNRPCEDEKQWNCNRS